MDFLWPVIALAAGFGAGWVLSRMRATSELARFEGRLEELQGRLVRAQRANEALLAEAGKAQGGPDGERAPADAALLAGPIEGALGGSLDGGAGASHGRRFADGLYEETDEASADAHDGVGDDDVEGDDLTRIRGIGAVLQDKLYDLGIYSYQQVAALTAEETAYLDRALRLRGRIARDDWVGQAKRLSSN